MKEDRSAIQRVITALFPLSFFLLVSAGSILSGCPHSQNPPDTEGKTVNEGKSSTEGEAVVEGETGQGRDTAWSQLDVSTLKDDYDALDYAWNSAEVSYIQLNGDAIVENAAGATASGSVLTISSSGTYSLRGNLSNGRIIVDTDSDDEGTVRLIFNGVDIACSYSAPFYVANAKRTVIILADGTSNALTDPATYTYFDDAENGEPNAAIYSCDYLTIGAPANGNGSGSLTVDGNYGDGITSEDGLVLHGGAVTVDAADDRIRGKDFSRLRWAASSSTTSIDAGLRLSAVTFHPPLLNDL